MPLNIPVPADDTVDCVPIAGSQIEVGTDLLSLWAVTGTVTEATPPWPGHPWWVYLMVTMNPDGTASVGVALFPETLPDDWWGRVAVWRRAPKLADGARATADDTSKWIYPAGGDGRMRCYAAGSSFAQGDLRFRGELTMDARDLWICDDEEWDWLPVTAGGQVGPGDTITFLQSVQGVVDDVQVSQDAASLSRTFLDDTGAVLGVWYQAIYQHQSTRLLNEWTWFERLPKPAADATFRADDGSRWIFTGGSAYYCWAAGSAYPAGSVRRRGEITGGLRPITP